MLGPLLFGTRFSSHADRWKRAGKIENHPNVARMCPPRPLGNVCEPLPYVTSLASLRLESLYWGPARRPTAWFAPLSSTQESREETAGLLTKASPKTPRSKPTTPPERKKQTCTRPPRAPPPPRPLAASPSSPQPMKSGPLHRPRSPTPSPPTPTTTTPLGSSTPLRFPDS